MKGSDLIKWYILMEENTKYVWKRTRIESEVGIRPMSLTYAYLKTQEGGGVPYSSHAKLLEGFHKMLQESVENARSDKFFWFLNLCKQTNAISILAFATRFNVPPSALAKALAKYKKTGVIVEYRHSYIFDVFYNELKDSFQ